MENKEILRDYSYDEFIKQFYENEKFSEENFQILHDLVRVLFESKSAKNHSTIANFIIRKDKSLTKGTDLTGDESFQALKEFKKNLRLVLEFMDIIRKISDKYRGITNIEFCPKLRN